MAICDRGYYWMQPLNRPISSLFGTMMSNLFQGRSQHPRSKAGYSSQYILMIPHSYSMKPLFKRFPKMRALPNHRKIARFSIETHCFGDFWRLKKKLPKLTTTPRPSPASDPQRAVPRRRIRLQATSSETVKTMQGVGPERGGQRGKENGVLLATWRSFSF